MDQNTNVDEKESTPAATAGDAKQDKNSNSKDSTSSDKAAAKKKAPAKKKATPKAKPSAKDDGQTQTTGSKKLAARFVGIPTEEVFHFVQDGDRYRVVTIDGRKLTETPAERETREAREAKELADRQAEAAKNQR